MGLPTNVAIPQHVPYILGQMTHIQKLKSPDDPKDILLAFQQYYSVLYNHFHDVSK